MNWTAQNVVYGRTFVNTILAAFAAAPLAELIDTAKIRLSQNPAFAPDPDSAIADLTPTEADYSGYTAGGIAMVVSAPLNLGTDVQGTMSSVLFKATTATPFVSNTVYGWWIDDGTNLICGEAFPGGVNALFGSINDFLQLDVVTPLPLYQTTGITN